MIPHLFRCAGITIKLIGNAGEEVVVHLDEFAAVSRGDRMEVTDHPAGGFKFPFVRQSYETVVRCDIREKGELTAAAGAVIALAKRRTLASHQQQVFRCLRP